MVSKLLKALNKEFNSINQAAILLGTFMLASQFLGLIRDRLLAGKLGAGLELDIYVAAFKIPDLIFAVAASLVSVTILIPFIDKKINQDKNGKRIHTKAFINSIFTSFFVSISILSIIIFFAMPVLAPLVAPGFEPEAMKALVQNARVMLLSPILLGFSNIFGTITQAFKKFTVYALSPAFYNVGIIIGVIFLYPHFGLTGIAFGVILGALFHGLIQFPVLIKERLIPRLTTKINWKEIKDVVFVSVPRTLTLAFHQIIFIVFVSFASRISEGSISIFQFAYVLQSVPFAIIGISYSVAAFPTLVKYWNNGNIQKFVSAILVPTRQIIFWSIPVIVMFIVLRAQIVRVILGTGNFDWTDTRLTAAALALFVISIVSQGLIALIVRAYYASGNTIRPLVVNFTSAILSISYAYILMRIFDNSPGFVNFVESLLRVEGISNTKILMLPLAYSLGIITNFLILWCMFKRTFLEKVPSNILRAYWQSGSASLIGGFATYLLLGVLDNYFDINTLAGVFQQGFYAGIVGITISISFLFIIKNPEIISTWKALRSKFWKAKVIQESTRSEM